MGRENLDEEAYVSLPDHPKKPNGLAVTRIVPWIAVFATVGLLLFSGSELLQAARRDVVQTQEMAGSISRGKPDGVSEKTAGIRASPYPWTNAQLSWQRTGFHFQPQENWMNDPDGPLYYKEWYHLFYQYNPDSAVWGNITWGHAVSKDLVRWLYLPIALAPSAWYDSNGVWTGSATVLHGGQLVVLYTGSTNESVQVQNLAVPENLSDPLLLKWKKSERNPVLVPPRGIGLKDFRDPTSGWPGGRDGFWRIAIGSRLGSAGVALVFSTEDFVEYEQQNILHQVPGTGMWECVDFYPVSLSGVRGLAASANGDGVKHVLKASLDDDKHDYYAIGTYDVEAQIFVPDDPEMDVGVGLRLDYGKYYASKTFFDPVRQRRILWGWVGETDSEQDDLRKGWASVQTVPRIVWLDNKTKTNLIQWPVEEINDLRTSNISLEDVLLQPGSLLEVNASLATQLDIELTFDFPEEAMNNVVEADVVYNCSTSGGSAGRGVAGPFGLLVLADKNLTEQTAVYFYIAKSVDGQLKTFFCQDETRSSLATDLILRVYGSSVPVLLDEKAISVRVLVDHSIVESYAQGGRTCIASRVYPTRAVYGDTHLFLFNNATTVPLTIRSVNVWQMSSVNMHPYVQ